MAAFERFNDMGDVRLKPRMLRTLLREHVPDEKQPLSSPIALSKVVSIIQTHKLLSESFTESPVDQKLADSWKSAVDDWINRLLALTSSNMPDKCWAGICLMGVTCQECSSGRFLASYSIWFNKLLPHIQQLTGSQIVKVASCSSVSDLLTRLASFPHTKKDGTSHSGKLIQPVMKLLNEDISETVWEGALHLLSSIIIFFPGALHSCYDKVEAAIASNIFSGKSSDNMLKKLAHCLALLPKAKGDEGSWSFMMQKLLLSINTHLNNFFQGLEEETKGSEATRLLVPPGKDPPAPLGGQTGVLDDTTFRSEQLITSRVSALMFCCCTMLTSSYNVQVNVPIRSLLALVERVLAVDGSLSRTMLPFMTSMQQEFVCAELPVLHSYALEVLIATVKSIRGQLLPHAASIVRLVTSYFRKCSLPELRIKLYSITRMLLLSMGVGMAMHLAQEVIFHASADVKPIGIEVCNTSSSENPKTSNRGPLQPSLRKRKLDNSDSEVGTPKNNPSVPISVKIAALEALEALLTVGGALRSEQWRSSIDSLLMSTALKACNKSNHFMPSESTSIWADFQLTAFRALLASLLSPSHVRPAFLAQGLELFRTGRQETGTKLAEFCAHALMSLEVLIHPRALPLEDYSSPRPKFPQNTYFGSQKSSGPTSSNMHEMENTIPDQAGDDDLYNRWLENGDVVGVPSNNQNESITKTTNPPEFPEHASEEVAATAQGIAGEPKDVEIETTMEEAADTGHGNDDSDPKDDEMERETAALNSGTSDHPYQEAPSGKNILPDAEKVKKGDDSDEDSLSSFPGLADDDFVSGSESDSD